MTEIEPGELRPLSFWQELIREKDLFVGKIITLPDREGRWEIKVIDDTLGSLQLVGVDDPSNFTSYFIDQLP